MSGLVSGLGAWSVTETESELRLLKQRAACCSAGVGKERHATVQAHPHDATCVKEEWDEFLEIYVHLVKNICMCAHNSAMPRVVVPPPLSLDRVASQNRSVSADRSCRALCRRS